jgi:NAD-dependent SIR2 family protein deacetylase
MSLESVVGPSVRNSAPSDPRPEALALLRTRPFVALTGAGLSTDSGIPDYRGPGSPSRRPMTYQEFAAGPDARQRYWARSHLGWGRMKHASPNAGHEAMARLDASGAMSLLITQNVDGLHERAGAERVVALHGRIADVCCLRCRAQTSRAALHTQLESLNPGFAALHASAVMRPDGDVELSDTDDFVVPDCAACGGVLKPDVVFFGENVPPERVARCYTAVEALADTGGALLVAGSSLAVMSGLRFVKRAAKAGTPIVIINRGATRGDEYATYKLDVGCSEFLAELAA